MVHGFLDFSRLTGFAGVTWPMAAMWGVAAAMLYFAIGKRIEPLLLVPIAFGALLANLPTGPVAVETRAPGRAATTAAVADAAPPPRATDVAATVAHDPLAGRRIERGDDSLFEFVSRLLQLGILVPLIFLGVGTLTDFGPLIASPRMVFIAAAAQLGMFATFTAAGASGFSPPEAAAIGIAGGADGATAIFVAGKLAPHLLGPVAVAACGCMALMPLIQSPVLRLLTGRKERCIRMKTHRKVSKLEKLVFAVAVMVVCILIVPAVSPLIAMLMLGNFLRECGVLDRLLRTGHREIVNVLTIFLGASVGLTMAADHFLTLATLKITALGVVAFCVATAGGVLMAKLMNLLNPNDPVNPLIGSAGVSALPLAAQVSQMEGQRADANNYLLMHATGANVAGVIGLAIAAGYFLSTLP